MTFEQFMKRLGFDPDAPRDEAQHIMWNVAQNAWQCQQANIEYLQHSIDIYLGARDKLAAASKKIDEEGAAYD